MSPFILTTFQLQILSILQDFMNLHKYNSLILTYISPLLFQVDGYFFLRFVDECKIYNGGGLVGLSISQLSCELIMGVSNPFLTFLFHRFFHFCKSSNSLHSHIFSLWLIRPLTFQVDVENFVDLLDECRLLIFLMNVEYTWLRVFSFPYSSK